MPRKKTWATAAAFEDKGQGPWTMGCRQLLEAEKEVFKKEFSLPSL